MKRIAFVAMMTFAVPGSVTAQAPEDDGALRANCVGDYFRFCSTTIPGTEAIRACFRRNLGQLTPGCFNAIQAFDRRAAKRR